MGCRQLKIGSVMLPWCLVSKKEPLKTCISGVGVAGTGQIKIGFDGFGLEVRRVRKNKIVFLSLRLCLRLSLSLRISYTIVT